MASETSSYYLSIALIAAFVLIFLLAVFIRWYLNEFLPELTYLNKEIQRTDGKEKEEWLKKKKRLMLSLLPFVKY